MRVLIMGATGLLGHTLVHAWKDTFDVHGTINTDWRNELRHPCIEKHLFGVNSFGSCSHVIRCVEPDVVVNCIGIVKQRHSSPADMIEVNSLFPHRLSTVCKQINARLIHISTDCVFSGKYGNYREIDKPDPTDNYGRTKLLGEIPQDLTIRTSFVGRELPGRTHHGLWEWLRSHPRGATVLGYSHVLYSGLVVLELANVLRRIILDWPDLRGLFHVSGPYTSKDRLLQMVNAQCDLGLIVSPTSRPYKIMTLNSAAFQNLTGYEPPIWREQISQYRDWTKTLGIYDD